MESGQVWTCVLAHQPHLVTLGFLWALKRCTMGGGGLPWGTCGGLSIWQLQWRGSLWRVTWGRGSAGGGPLELPPKNAFANGGAQQLPKT